MTNKPKRESISDFELTAHAFRMMRDGGYVKLSVMRADFQRCYPNETPARLDGILKQLARKLLENDK